VTDIDLLTTRLEADPANTILAAMLTDELMDTRDMLRSEADRHVSHVQATATQARQLAEATHLMHRGSASGRWLQPHCRRWVHLPARSYYMIVVIAGDSAPLIPLGAGATMHRPWVGILVTVGAAWVIREWEAHIAQRRRDARYRRVRAAHERQVSSGSARVE
jgi:hypothetical protein